MRQIIFIILILTSCGQIKSDFDQYLEQIDKIETPVTFHSTKYSGTTKYQNYKTELFKKYGKSGSHELQGLIYKNERFVGLLFNIIGDINRPFLITYDRQGNKIDSLNIFPNANSSLNTETVDHATIYSDNKIEIISESKTWELNNTSDDIVKGTDKLKVDTLQFSIDNKGKISIIKKNKINTPAANTGQKP